MITRSTTALREGDRVLTTDVVGEDFGLPIVERPKGKTGIPREVRACHRARGGCVVWFTDGTKTAPLHGRTNWRLPSGDAL